jgi:hypothetical protein
LFADVDLDVHPGRISGTFKGAGDRWHAFRMAADGDGDVIAAGNLAGARHLRPGKPELARPRAQLPIFPGEQQLLIVVFGQMTDGECAHDGRV